MLVVGLLLVVALVTARLMLPSYIRSYVNRTLDESTEYDGRVGKVRVDLWRGVYVVEDIEVVKTTHTVPIPFFEARSVEFAVDWRALRQGMVRGRVVVTRPRLNFVKGPTPEETQTGAGERWLAILDELFPFRVDRAEIVDGEIHFRTFHTEPRVNVWLSEVQATLSNLTNVADSTDPLMARVKARGTAMEDGKFELDMRFDPSSYRPAFTLAARLLDVDVTKLHSLTRAYGDFDFEAGWFDFAAEVTAQNGFVSGYAKPLFRNLVVVGHEDFENDDPLQVLWEALVGAVGAVFKNQSRDQFGTRIAIEGDLDNPRTDLFEVIGNVLRNAFVRAYLPRLERRTPVERIGESEAGGTTP